MAVKIDPTGARLPSLTTEVIERIACALAVADEDFHVLPDDERVAWADRPESERDYWRDQARVAAVSLAIEGGAEATTIAEEE